MTSINRLSEQDRASNSSRGCASSRRGGGPDPDQTVTHDGEELMLTDELPFTSCVWHRPRAMREQLKRSG